MYSVYYIIECYKGKNFLCEYNQTNDKIEPKEYKMKKFFAICLVLFTCILNASAFTQAEFQRCVETFFNKTTSSYVKWNNSYIPKSAIDEIWCNRTQFNIRYAGDFQYLEEDCEDYSVSNDSFGNLIIK